MDVKPHRLLTHRSFFSAVRSGDLDSVKLLLEGDDRASISALVASQNEAGETALYISADNNLEEIFNYLVNFCDFETAAIKSSSGINALHVAAKRGNSGIVKELLNRWPLLCKLCGPSNFSPLYSAAIQDHLDVVNAILDADESSARILRKNGKTPLHTTARNGSLRIVKALLDKDPGIVSFKDKKGQTALHMAVKGRNPDVVDELLQIDLSILNERDRKGNTAFHTATRKWRSEMVCLLLQYGSIDVNAVNNQNETAMDLAEKLPYGDAAFQIKEALVDAGAKHAKNLRQTDEAMELSRTVRDIKHEVHTQLIQNAKTNKRVTGIAKELQKLHREAVQNTTNSVTIVAVLFASIAFMAIFNFPGQYFRSHKMLEKPR